MNDTWTHLLLTERTLERPDVPPATTTTFHTAARTITSDCSSLHLVYPPPGMTQVATQMGCLPQNTPVPASEQQLQVDPSQIPRRNLTEAFEELYIEPGPEENAMTTKSCGEVSNPIVISPTAVTDLDMERRLSVETRDDANPSTTSTVSADLTMNDFADDENDTTLPYFYLHTDLKRDLSQAVVNRVSFYGIIHDINKEASTMASNDESCYHLDDLGDNDSAIVAGATGKPNTNIGTDALAEAALVDEERWLLAAIEHRGPDESRPLQGCPSTFLQAMGEREYEHPSNSTTFRTQLWKPSRSWWEAKSGKNPWIEPKSHNKRWR